MADIVTGPRRQYGDTAESSAAASDLVSDITAGRNDPLGIERSLDPRCRIAIPGATPARYAVILTLKAA